MNKYKFGKNNLGSQIYLRGYTYFLFFVSLRTDFVENK